MTFQTDIFGNLTFTGTTRREVEKIIDKFPHAVDRPHLFFWLAMKEYCPAVAQLPETAQQELRAYCRDIESLRRRRQEHRSRSLT